MKVYAVIEKYSDEYDSDYDVVVEDCAYLNEKDARKRKDELVKEHRWSKYKILCFEVKE